MDIRRLRKKCFKKYIWNRYKNIINNGEVKNFINIKVQKVEDVYLKDAIRSIRDISIKDDIFFHWDLGDNFGCENFTKNTIVEFFDNDIKEASEMYLFNCIVGIWVDYDKYPNWGYFNGVLSDGRQWWTNDREKTDHEVNFYKYRPDYLKEFSKEQLINLFKLVAIDNIVNGSLNHRTETDRAIFSYE